MTIEQPNRAGHLCLSFDFDGPSLWVMRKMTTPTPISRGEYGAVVIPRILRLLEQRGLPATFFIPGHTIETHPDACRMIVDAGCEVGLHGYAHELNALQSLDEERAAMGRSVELISTLTGTAPLGYRAPAGDPTEQTFDLLEEFGVVYDSSLMGHDYRPYQVRLATDTPDDGPITWGPERSLVELPWSWTNDDYPYLEFVAFRRMIMPGLGRPEDMFANFLGDVQWMTQGGRCRGVDAGVPPPGHRPGPSPAGLRGVPRRGGRPRRALRHDGRHRRRPPPGPGLRPGARGHAVTGGLTGLRVLEIGEWVSAPYASKLLADMGADVIKVEPPGGDPARHRGPFPASGPDPDASGLFLALNTGKRSVVIDPDDHDVGGDHDGHGLGPLLATTDIVITNLRPDRLDALGVHLDQLLAERPEVVICAISPFGATGPNADYRAVELTAAHGGGWAYQSPGALTDPDLPPLKIFGHQTDFHAGTAAATICLAAHHRAKRTGVGDLIDFSSMAHVTGMLEGALIAASYMDLNPSRLGSRLLNPWKIFDCRPGADPDLIFLVTVEQDQWERLVAFMGEPEWAQTGLFDTVELRLENEDLLVHFLSEWMADQDAEELWHRGQKERICFAPVLTMAGMERQQHLHDRGFFATVDHPTAGPLTHLGAPFRSTPRLHRDPEPAPLLPDTDGPRPGFLPSPGGTGPTGTEPEWTAPATVTRGVGDTKGEDDRALSGIRVLDLTWVWAGPYCTLHLAHLGAEVIKIESGLRPGLGRRLPLHPPDVEPSLNTSSYFNQWDQGKLSCRMDLRRPEAIELIKRMVAECDVVVENFATGVMERLGLSYPTLEAINPELIVASISGYGSEGPLREYIGYGPTTGPLSGLSSLTGYRGGGPRELGLSIGDPAAGITTALAICAAVVARRTTGRGCYIDTALWESIAVHTVEGWMAHAMTGAPPDRMGNRDPRHAPHGCYRTGPDPTTPDGELDPGLWITIACTDNEQWRALAGLIDPALAEDPRFATENDRKTNEDTLDELLADWVGGQDRWELTAELQAAGIAAYPSMSPKDLLADEHLWARGFFERLPHAEVGARVHAGIPWRSTTGANGVRRAAPLLGQHTDDVLRTVAGLSDDQITRFRQRGVLE